MRNYADLMFQDAVAELQTDQGSYDKFQKFYVHRTQEALSSDDIAFIRAANSFYIASTTSDGWPYIQHRGGPRGFLRVTSPTRLAIADYKGNQQFITQGNLQSDTRVSLFLMDYLNKTRLKIQGRATLVPIDQANPELVAQLETDAGPAERVMEIEIVAMDWNCPKYIPALYPEDAVQQIFGPEIEKLRAENAELHAQLTSLQISKS
jgi:predicted pyridoxine 5'-phosphate oxidase superfamily flavin-nucleotide-binding protein